MNTITIELPKTIYDVVVEHAAKQNQTPAHFIKELLAEQLLPVHPYVEVIKSRSGPRAIIKNSRVGVDIIIGYTQAGYTPREIATDILPHLTLAQIYDALSYYEDHRAAIDNTRQANTPEVWRERLRKQMGDEAVTQLLGGNYGSNQAASG
jgi:uncharacterized protein (DUF433 family)